MPWRLPSAHGRLDGLVIASGVVAFGRVGNVPDDVPVDLFLVNTLAPIRLLQVALPHLVASGADGHSPFVVNLSAVVAEQPDRRDGRLPGVESCAHCV